MALSLKNNVAQINRFSGKMQGLLCEEWRFIYLSLGFKGLFKRYIRVGLLIEERSRFFVTCSGSAGFHLLRL